LKKTATPALADPCLADVGEAIVAKRQRAEVKDKKTGVIDPIGLRKLYRCE
jgi:hypothetical protein